MLRLNFTLFFLVIIFLSFQPAISAQTTVNWTTETGLVDGTTIVDGQVIMDIAGTGLNAVINANIVESVPRVAAGGTVIAIGPNPTNASGASFTLTFLNGNADIILYNQQNLLRNEDIRISNPDGKAITVNETASNGGVFKVDGVATAGTFPRTIVGDDSVLITNSSNGVGTDFNAQMSGITSFTWLYETDGNFEGFTLAISNPIVLPIVLGSFEAVNLKNKEVQLNWTTLSELNNEHFNVERSTDGINWKSIVKLKAAGNSAERSNYSYIDKIPNTEINYYRLKQTDFDGSFTYSNIESVRINRKLDIKVYPNPTSNHIYIESADKELLNFLVFDQTMKNVTNQVLIQNLGEFQYYLTLNSLPSGMYFINTENQFIKVLKTEIKR